MTNRAVISTTDAPNAVGPYSQAVKVGNLVWISGQIALHPKSNEILDADISGEARQAFVNLSEISKAAGGSISDAVKINISLVKIEDFDDVNKVMEEFFQPPYPARACVQVAALPKGASIEIEAILSI